MQQSMSFVWTNNKNELFWIALSTQKKAKYDWNIRKKMNASELTYAIARVWYIQRGRDRNCLRLQDLRNNHSNNRSMNF